MGRRKCDRYRPHQLTLCVGGADCGRCCCRFVSGGVTDALYNPTVGEFYTAGAPRDRAQGCPGQQFLRIFHGPIRVLPEISKQTVKTWNANTGVVETPGFDTFKILKVQQRSCSMLFSLSAKIVVGEEFSCCPKHFMSCYLGFILA